MNLSRVLTPFIRIASVNGDRIMAYCPFHHDTKPSLSINQKKGLYHCFGCGKSGIVHKLLEYFVGGIRASLLLEGIEFCPDDEEEFPLPDILELPIYNGGREYLKSRGFTDATIDTWKLGESKELDAAIIPVFDASLTYRGWKARKRTTKGYFSSFGFPAKDILFGENFLGWRKWLYIVEGEFDVIWLWQNGYQALGLLGNSHVEKWKRLSEYKYKIGIFLDGDESGAETSLLLSKYLHRGLVLRWPGKDPSDLTESQLQYFLGSDD